MRRRICVPCGSKAGRRQRWITFRCDTPAAMGGCGSLGETLAGMVSAFVVSLVTERAFAISWEGVEDLVSQVELDWLPTADLNSAASKEGSGGTLGGVPSAEVAWVEVGGVERQTPRKVYRAFHALSAADNIVVRWRHGMSTWMVETRGNPWGARLRELGLRQPYAFGCLLRYLLR